jgi:hypothetical protein
VAGGGVVGDTVDPGAQAAAPVEPGQAAPERDVDILDQVTPRIGVGLVGPRQALDRRAELRGGGRIALIDGFQAQARLPCPSAR